MKFLITLIFFFFSFVVFSQKSFFKEKKVEKKYAIIKEWSKPYYELAFKARDTSIYYRPYISNITSAWITEPIVRRQARENLFLDEYFVPFFGKPIDKLTNKDFKKIKESWAEMKRNPKLPEEDTWEMKFLLNQSKRGSEIKKQLLAEREIIQGHLNELKNFETLTSKRYYEIKEQMASTDKSSPYYRVFPRVTTTYWSALIKKGTIIDDKEDVLEMLSKKNTCHLYHGLSFYKSFIISSEIHRDGGFMLESDKWYIDKLYKDLEPYLETLYKRYEAKYERGCFDYDCDKGLFQCYRDFIKIWSKADISDESVLRKDMVVNAFYHCKPLNENTDTVAALYVLLDLAKEFTIDHVIVAKMSKLSDYEVHMLNESTNRNTEIPNLLGKLKTKKDSLKNIIAQFERYSAFRTGAINFLNNLDIEHWEQLAPIDILHSYFDLPKLDENMGSVYVNLEKVSKAIENILNQPCWVSGEICPSCSGKRSRCNFCLGEGRSYGYKRTYHRTYYGMMKCTHCDGRGVTRCYCCWNASQR